MSQQLSMQKSVTSVPEIGLKEYIVDLANRNGVVYAKTSYDKLAETITRLSDDDIEMDSVELLLIALERAGVLASEAVVPLHVNYLREKFNVRFSPFQSRNTDTL